MVESLRRALLPDHLMPVMSRSRSKVTATIRHPNTSRISKNRYTGEGKAERRPAVGTASGMASFGAGFTAAEAWDVVRGHRVRPGAVA